MACARCGDDGEAEEAAKVIHVGGAFCYECDTVKELDSIKKQDGVQLRFYKPCQCYRVKRAARV